MHLNHSKIGGFLFVICLVLGCSQEQKSQQKTREVLKVTIDSLETFTYFDTHNISQPSEIEILDDGTLVVADKGQPKVSLIQTNGDVVTSFGRKGRGPGEFLTISNLFSVDDLIHVIDSDQQVISKFDRQGNFHSSHTFRSAALSKEVVPINRNTYAIATGGEENALISITDFETDSTFYLGSPKDINMKLRDLKTSLDQIKSGEVPNFFKNMITLRFDGNYIYIYLNAYSELRKYDTLGNLIWEQTLEFPQNEKIFNTAIERAKNPMGMIHEYNYIKDFVIINQEVVILTNRDNSDESQLLVRLNNNGETKAIYTLPAQLGYLSAFDWDPKKGVLYFASRSDGVVYKYELNS